jgi:hypothetical protein
MDKAFVELACQEASVPKPFINYEVLKVRTDWRGVKGLEQMNQFLH